MARTIRLDDIMTDGYFVITSLSVHGLMTWNQPLIIEVIARKADTREKEVIGFTKKNSLIIINNILIPFLFGMAFLVFVFNAIRFFVAQSNNQDGREKARNLITYSLLAFVFLIVFWGIINVLVQSLGLECDRFESKKITSDYEVKYMPPGPTVAICP